MQKTREMGYSEKKERKGGRRQVQMKIDFRLYKKEISELCSIAFDFSVKYEVCCQLESKGEA